MTQPLDKVSVGAIVATIVLLLGVFGIDIPDEVSSTLVAVIAGIVSIVAYFTTSYLLPERETNLRKLKPKF